MALTMWFGGFRLPVPPPVVVPDPPALLSAPVITGTPTEGQTLTGTTGEWVGADSFAFEWRRDGAVISGAEAIDYLLAADDVDALAITLVVYATNAGGTASAVSNAIGPIASSVPPAALLLDNPDELAEPERALLEDGSALLTE